MIALAITCGLLFAGAIVTLIASRLIERAHPPRGRRIEVSGFYQHVVELAPADVAREPPIVLLHGAGCNLEDMRLALGERLSVHRRVILIDRPGAGWSECDRGEDHSPAAQAKILRGLLDRIGVQRAIVCGHSWGGALALTFALNYPDRVAGLVLLAPPTHPRLRRLAQLYRILGMPFAGWLFAHMLALPLAAAAFALGIRAAFRPQVPPPNCLKRSAAFLLLRPAAFLANARDIACLQAFLARQVPRYRELAVPTVIINGDCDRIVPVKEHAAAFAAAAPAAKLVILPGVGHMPHYAVPDRVVAEIEGLMRELPVANGKHS